MLFRSEALISAERASEAPKVFTKIHIRFMIEGNDLDESSVERAIRLSAEKYCSATIMMSKSVEITHDYRIINLKEIT